MVNPLLLPEIRWMLAEGDTAGLTELMTELHPAMIAEFTEGLTFEETWQLMDHAPIERQAEVLAFFPLEKQVELVSGAGREHVSKLLEAMSHDDRVDLLKRLDEELVDDLLPLVAKADREDIRRLLSYPEDSAGAVMTTDYATLPPDVTAGAALVQLRLQAAQRETIYYIYVVDNERRLVGFVSLEDLILAKPITPIRDIMQSDPLSVRVDEDRESVARKLAEYDFLAIPVVDEQLRLVGIVTFDDVADVMEAEATEDFHLVAAVAPLEFGYSRSSALSLYRRRIGWLILLLFLSFISSGIIRSYEETLGGFLVLAAFIPMLIGSGGNTGSQAATLIIRALATEEIHLGQWLKVVGKEVVVGLTIGTTMAAASFVVSAVLGGSVIVGVVIGLTMLVVVMTTNLMGVVLPFLLTRLRFDPAVASSPLITTVADAAGLTIYFTIATRIMHWMEPLDGLDAVKTLC